MWCGSVRFLCPLLVSCTCPVATSNIGNMKMHTATRRAQPEVTWLSVHWYWQLMHRSHDFRKAFIVLVKTFGAHFVSHRSKSGWRGWKWGANNWTVKKNKGKDYLLASFLSLSCSSVDSQNRKRERETKMGGKPGLHHVSDIRRTQVGCEGSSLTQKNSVLHHKSELQTFTWLGLISMGAD